MIRVLIALENRFLKTKDGNVYSTTVCDYSFWQWYLQVFDEVVVFARVKEVQEPVVDRHRSNGPNVRFVSIPYFVGPWQYFKNYKKLKKVAKQTIHEADAFILRVPGVAANLIWQQLSKSNIPYAIEAVGDPWDSLAPGSIKSILRPFFRRKATGTMAQQCKHAVAAAYVTESALQKRYPSDGWMTSFSDVRLAGGAIGSEQTLKTRVKRIIEKSVTNGSWCLCHVGMMEHLYKAQDVLLEAIAICLMQGIKIKLSFLGDGKYKTQLQKQAKKLNIVEHVHFKGRIQPGKALFEELDKADLFVLPSRQEGLPRSVAEAMARGLPCIGSNVGGFPELLAVEDMVQPNNVRALAGKIIEVLTSRDRMIDMARQNLKNAHKYAPEELNRRRVAFYTKVVQATNNYFAEKRK